MINMTYKCTMREIPKFGSHKFSRAPDLVKNIQRYVTLVALKGCKKVSSWPFFKILGGK